MNIFIAFLLRDLAIEKTYRFHLALKIAGAAAQLAVFFFVSRFLEKPDYFIFVFVGLMFSGFFQFFLNVFAEVIRQEQYWGTMEQVFLCPRKPLSVLLASLSGKFFLMIAELCLFLILGLLIFGEGFHINVIGLIPLLLLNALAFGGIGLLSGSFIMYFKRGDPVNWVLGATLDLVSGIYFPVTVLPNIIRNISDKLPTTSALDLWRGVLLNGKLPELSQLSVQALWAVLLFGAGAWAFVAAYNKTREKGDLGSY